MPIGATIGSQDPPYLDYLQVLGRLAEMQPGLQIWVFAALQKYAETHDTVLKDHGPKGKALSKYVFVFGFFVGVICTTNKETCATKAATAFVHPQCSG